ncbi:MAG: hypothetical protein ABFS86_08330 [Planctomycetota bacterium]
MAARQILFLILVAGLFLAGCPSSAPLTQDEIPGDFEFSYEMKVTDEEAFQRALDEEEAKKTAEGGAAEEAAPEDTAAEAAEPGAETEGLPVTYAYVVVTDPGHVVYEIHFGIGNPVKRKGRLDLNESAYEEIYRLVRDADVFSLKKRYVGDRSTGIQETFVVKGNLHWQVIDVKGTSVPVLEKMWESVKEILLDKEARMFDNPKERSDVFIIDRRNKEFHRGDCPKLNEVSAEYRIRKNTKEECLNAEAWPCETCRPLEER